MEEERKPILSLNFEIEDIKMQYAAMEKYMEGMDKVSWEYKHADKIKTELYRAIAHHKYNLDKEE
tara:strand:- start:360 stop:554 length:195 start_codon:yes stop_codon:yes gene_type:complete